MQLSDRIARIERHLDLARPNSMGSSGRAETSAKQSSHETQQSDELGSIQPDTGDEGGTPSLRLPMREDAQHYVECYFRHLNSGMPLFDRSSFLRILDRWYSSPDGSNSVQWAAIQVVLALGIRAARFEFDGVSLDATMRVNQYLANAQSVFPDLVTHDEDLLGLQTLLGIVILLQNRSDQKPGSAVIASAMRLAHRLNLQSSSSGPQRSPSEEVQRSRVFWIAYMLDKVGS